MPTTNPIADIDAKVAIGGPALRPRSGGNGRHQGKIPDMFPAVLADFKLSKNVAPEAFGALDVGEKSIGGEGEPDSTDTTEASPNEETVQQPMISPEMKQWLQNLAVVGQMQAGRDESTIVRESVDELLLTVASRHETKLNGDCTDGEAVKDVSENVENSEALGIDQLKLAEPREQGNEATRNFPSPSNVSGDSRIKDTQFAMGLSADDSIKSLQIPARSHEAKSGTPAEPDKKNVSPSKIPSGELPRPETLSDLQETKQTKPADVEIRVIKVETSFSPTASQSFVQQFSKVVTDTLDAPVKGAALVAANPVPDPRPDVVRSIQIQLHPADLGKIKVAMHLRGEELRLKIEVTSKEVEMLLQNDHQVLKDLLGQSGYDIKDASISITLSPNDLLPPQRSIAANEPSAESLVGQGSRQHPGAGEDNQNPFQKARGHHAFAAEFESDQGARSPAAGSRRGSGVFV